MRWNPESHTDRGVVYEALDKILTSPQFRNSKRYPGFLRYVVDQALNGDIEQIKERTVGVEVFGRAPDYDTAADTVVRYTAGEVRKRLALYYSNAPDEQVQIAISARSYQPEFYRIVETEDHSASENTTETQEQPLEPAAQSASAGGIHLPGRHNVVAGIACACLGVALVLFAQWALMAHRTQASDRFWSPVAETRSPVLIAPGGVVFSSSSKIGTEVASSMTQSPFLSLENAMAMGRVESLLSSRESAYEILPAANVTLSQIRENSIVLIGAYNNEWTQRLLMPLRFHFVPPPGEAIVDTWHSEKQWTRDRSKPSSEAPDYGLVARFRDPTTDGIVVVVAGLQRYGTDGASQFAVSPRFLDLLNRQIGSNWRDKNIEVVIRVDVVNGRAGAPITEAVHVW